MRWHDSWRPQDSNAVNESFWDAQNVEIEACANFIRQIRIWEIFPVPGTNLGTGKQISDWMLWVRIRQNVQKCARLNLATAMI